MSPEERATALMARIQISTGRNLAHWLPDVIAAIRAAENEALKRAEWICGDLGSEASPDYRDEYANGWHDASARALELIRSLKSTPPEGK